MDVTIWGGGVFQIGFNAVTLLLLAQTASLPLLPRHFERA